MNKQLTNHTNGSISTSDINVSYIYPNSLPLDVVYIHEYNPIIDKIIAINCNNCYIIIDKPIGNNLLLRPHYYFGRNLSGNNKISVIATVNDIYNNNIILTKDNYQIHIHDNVCSPNNMQLNLGVLNNKSYLLSSIIEDIITYHFIPMEDQWSFIYTNIFGKELKTVKDIFDVLNNDKLFYNDELFIKVKEIILN